MPWTLNGENNPFSPAQTRVIEFFANNTSLTQKEAARRLRLSRQTIKNRISGSNEYKSDGLTVRHKGILDIIEERAGQRPTSTGWLLTLVTLGLLVDKK